MATELISRRELAVKTDTELASLYADAQRAQERIRAAQDGIHSAAGDKRVWFGNRKIWNRSFTDVLRDAGSIPTASRSIQAHLTATKQHTEILARMDVLNAIWREYRWNRYFEVTSSDGHVHRGMSCHTCFATTIYNWITELADCDEDDMIEEFGEKACTVCFPTAPANPKFHAPGRRDAAAQAVRQAEKDARQAAKNAKQLTDDEVFCTRYMTDRVNTVAACKELLRKPIETTAVLAHYRVGPSQWADHQAWSRYVDGIADSLALQEKDAEQARAVLLAREAVHEGWGQTVSQINRIVLNAERKARKDWA